MNFFVRKILFENRTTDLMGFVNSFEMYGNPFMEEAKSKDGFVFLEDKDVEFMPHSGYKNSCEQNVYNFIKENLKYGYNFFYQSSVSVLG